VAQQRLADRGIRTIGELARTSSAAVERLLGHAVGSRLSALSHNEDPRRVATSGRARSVGAQSALGRQGPTPQLVREVLGHLADRVAARLRARNRAGRTVTVRVRFTGMRAVTRSATLGEPIASTLTLTEVAERLAWQAIDDEPDPNVEITLLAVSVSNLTTRQIVQLELPLQPEDPWRPGSGPGSARWAVDRSMDAVRSRFGRDAVGYLPAAMSRSSSVPDDFRELAERDPLPRDQALPP
jgi:DNA polymerase IV